MKKATDQVIENLKHVDAIIQVIDARAPQQSINPDLALIIANKPILTLAMKSDWSDLKQTDLPFAQLASIKNQVDRQKIISALDKLLEPKILKLKAKGLVNPKFLVMVVGLPNIGKSSLINFLANKNHLQAQNKPGLTKTITRVYFGVAVGSFTPVLMLGGLTPLKGVTSINWMSYLGLFFSPNLLASLLGTIIAGLTLNALFPKHKAVKVQVYSKDTRLIANAIHANGWSHQVAVHNNDDSLSWTSKTSLETVCFYLELPNLIKILRNVDKEALILIYPVADIDGEMVTTVSK